MDVLNQYLNFVWNLDKSLYCLNEDVIVAFYLDVDEAYFNCYFDFMMYSCCFHYQD